MPQGLAQDLNNLRNAKVGVIDLYYAPEDTAYGAADPAWTYFGTMEPGTFNCDFPRTEFNLDTGFPRTNKMKAITGMSGTMEFTLTEYTAMAAELCAGSGPGARTYATTPAGTTVASSPSVNGATLTSGTGYAAGQLLEVLGPSGTKWLTYADTVNTGTGVVTWKPALPEIPATGATVKAVKQISQAMGTSQVPRYAIKARFMDQWGETITLYMAAASTGGDYKPNFADAQSNVKLPMKFNAYGKQQTVNGKAENVVANIYHDYANVS